MSAATQRTLAHIEQAGVIPVVRPQSEQAARELITGLLDAGRPIIEITLTTPGAMTLIAKLAGRTDVVVGAGTVAARSRARILQRLTVRLLTRRVTLLKTSWRLA